jgi:hypothetical protein
LMIPLTMLGEKPVVWSLAIGMALWLCLWRGWRVALLMLAIMLFAEAASRGMNSWITPGEAMVHGGLVSIPVLMAGLVLGFLSVLAGHAMGRWSRAAVAAVCGCLVAAIAFSRLYLGADWLSGVLIGAFLSLVLTAIFGMAIEAIPARRIRPLGLMAFAALVMALAGMFHISRNEERAEQRYAARPMVRAVTQAEWTADGWKQLANRRIDLAGRTEEVFAAQWVGNLAQLEQSLTSQGWTANPIWRWPDAFQYLDSKATLERLPPRPVLHQGLKAKLTMSKADAANPQRRMVLRAFKAHVNVSVGSGAEPVFLISITQEVPLSRFRLYSIPATVTSAAATAENVLATLAANPRIQVLATNDDPLKPSRLLLAKP